MSKIKVAVSGANGQIGSVVLRHLAQCPQLEAIGICRNAVSAALIDSIGCEVRIGSIQEPQSAGRLLGDCEAVVNCALATGLPKESRLENRAIIKNLARLENCRIAILMSSVAVYGSCIDPERSRFEHPRPDTSYGKTKLHLERFTRRVFSRSPARCFILRLGHVYGPSQWLTRSIVELAQETDFKLAFDGRLLSNCIHASNLAVAFERLLLHSPDPGIYNVTDSPHRTWREIFDWHTGVLKLPRVQGMSEEESERRRHQLFRYGRRNLLAKSLIEVFRWVRSLPYHDLANSQAIRELGYSLMLAAPASLEKRFKKYYVLHSARLRTRLWTNPPIKIRPEMFCGSMPGRYLELPLASSALPDQESEMNRELEEWFRGVSGQEMSRREFSSSILN